MKKSNFETLLADYRSYLRFERSMSQNTISGYVSDIEKFFNFLTDNGIDTAETATGEDLAEFLSSAAQQKVSKRTQSRQISSLKSLYRFLESGGRISENPCDRIDSPKITRNLPDVLSVEEVVSIIESVDLTENEGTRNKAMLEMLYSCGLRVSELVNLKISDLFFGEGFIRVIGKGNKQRLIPVGEPAVKAVSNYLDIRKLHKLQKGYDDILFLNGRGGQLTRNMVFIIVKKQTEKAGIRKSVSPHTFRHSFASHLVENGADLRVVQEMLGHESILTTEIYTHIDTRKWHETILKYHPAR